MMRSKSERLGIKRQNARALEADVFAQDVPDTEPGNTILVICGMAEDEYSNVFKLTPEVHLSEPYLKVYESLIKDGGADLSYPTTLKEVARKRLVNGLISNASLRVKSDGAPIIGDVKVIRVINICF